MLVHGSVVSQDHRGQINLSFRILWPFLLPSVTPLLPPSSPPPSQPAPKRKQIQNGYNVLPNRIFKHLYLPCSSSAAQVKHHRLAPCLTLLRWKREWDILYWIWNLFLFSSPGRSAGRWCQASLLQERGVNMAWVYLSVAESPTWYWSLVSLPSSSQQEESPSCSSREDLVSRCLMVSPPHLPTAHLIVRTVLALVCFPSPLVCSSIVPYIKLSSSSSSRIHQLYQLNLLFSLLITTGKKVLPLLSLHWLSRWSSHPALLCSQSLKEKEIKHKYRILACKNPWCKGETISLLYFINPISLSLLLAPLLPAPGKSMLFVMMFCLPSASVHSLPPPATHQPLASIACFLCISRRPQK